MGMIRIDVASKRYQKGGAEVIQNLRLELQAGEFVVLIGPSGCGKSTLLNLIAGLDRDYEGSVTSVGSDHADLRIGYVFQNPRLLPWRTVRQNLELVAGDDAARALIDPLLNTMGLAEFQAHFPERLSLGMERRVALARAFVARPDLLLMDEPFVSLDPPTARKMRTLLLEVWQDRPQTVLFVTHDFSEAVLLADRLVFLAAAPMTILTEVPVDHPRELRQVDGFLATFRDELSRSRPAIQHLL